MVNASLGFADDFVKLNTAKLQQAEAADLRRMNVSRNSIRWNANLIGIVQTRFSGEILEKRDQARRSRPSVLTAQRRKKDTAARLKRLSEAGKPGSGGL